MQRILQMTVTSLLAGAIVLIVPSAGGAALPPNNSVFFWQPSIGAVTGTIIDGTYVQVQNAFDIGTGWTGAALSRDTLVLLNPTAQELGLATLTAGTYTANPDSPVGFKGAHFTKLTASCDSLLLYSPSSGSALAVHLTAGALDLKHAHSYKLGQGFTSVNASCNTLTLLNNKGTGIVGTLKNGTFVKTGGLKTGIANPLVAHTATSFVRFSTSGHQIEWGTSKNGIEKVLFGPLPEVGGLIKLAGTSTSMLFYETPPSPSAAARLVDGLASDSQDVPLSPGWQIIVGGR
jgi:hypothetical protein